MIKDMRFEEWSHSVAEPTNTGMKQPSPQPEKGRRQPKTTPPLPPPPNPKYLADQERAHPRSPAEASTSSPSSNRPPYDVHTQGPLTYFNYYFEEASEVPSEASDPAASRSKLPLALVGTGVVAATVVGGLLIADALKPPETTQSSDPTLKQGSTTKLPRPTSASPEQLNVERSPASTPPASKPRSKNNPNKTSSVESTPQLQTTSNSLPLPISAPETLALNSPLPAVTSRTPLQASSQRSLTSPSAATAPLPDVSVRPAIVERPLNLPMVPQVNAATNPSPASAPTNALPASAQSELPNETPFPPSVDPSTTAPGTTDSGPSPSTLPNSATPWQRDRATASPESMTMAGSTTAQPGSSNSTGASVNPSAPDNRPNTSDRLEGLDSPTIATQANQPTTLRQATASQTLAQSEKSSVRKQPGIQDYLALPQQQPAPVTLMPLSQQAAEEAVGTGKVGKFTVRQVEIQDYQKEWVASNQSVKDAAIALAFPAYGFIDYQRQLIVVLQEQPTNAPVQSRASVSSNS